MAAELSTDGAARNYERTSPVEEHLPKGLTSDEARRKLLEVGPNATPDAAVHPLRLVLSKFWAPVPCLLEAAIALQLGLGEYIEASIIAFLLIFNALIGFLHESRAQATIAALKSRLALNASVRLDGSWKFVPAAELVPGDIIKLSLGSVVAADAHLLDGSVLLDHSMLTGESLPVEAGPGLETYAGALVRRGEALAEVTATGSHTKFGRTAELVRTAHFTSSQQKAVFRVVRNLAGFNGLVTVLIVGYAYTIRLPIIEIIPLVLISVLASVPVALPATFTLATALGAQALARQGVLPTRLSAVDEAASMDVLCSDKTGTLTQNELAVTAVRPMGGFDEARVLQLAALASADMGPDPVDTAVRTAASRYAATDSPQLLKFIPFDPSTKMAEASTVDRDGAPLRAVKGAFAIVSGLAGPSPEAASAAHQPEKQGFRVLAVAVGAPTAMRIAGAVLDGPLALDNAISRDAAAIKHINSPVAGDADILLVPDLEAGNMLAKELSFLADADAAGIVLGACVPIILTSRADNVRTRLASCAVAALYAHDRRVAAAEVGKLAGS